jgi:hypothetical protein
MAESAGREPGAELDAEIAQRVFGERVRQYEGEDGPHRFIESYGLVRDLPPFSTDLGMAWRVVEHLRDAGFLVRVIEHPDSGRHHAEDRRAWEDRRVECVVEQTVRGVHRRAGLARAATPALAICRAALAAVGTGS